MVVSAGISISESYRHVLSSCSAPPLCPKNDPKAAASPGSLQCTSRERRLEDGLQAAARRHPVAEQFNNATSTILFCGRKSLQPVPLTLDRLIWVIESLRPAQLRRWEAWTSAVFISARTKACLLFAGSRGHQPEATPASPVDQPKGESALARRIQESVELYCARFARGNPCEWRYDRTP